MNIMFLAKVKNKLRSILNSKSKSNVAIAGTVFLICSFLQKGVSTITTPIFTRLLSTSEYGIYNVFVSWSSIFTIFVTFKISSGVLQQALVKFNNDKKEILSSIQGLSTLLCIAFLLIYFILKNVLNQITGLSTYMMIAMFISIWATNIFEIWAQGERTNFEYKKVAIVTILTTILKPMLGIICILVFPNNKVEARIYSLVFVELISYLPLLIICTDFKNLMSRKYWKYAVTFAIPLVPHYLSQQVLSQTDRIMINSMCGSEQAGIYSLAYQIAMVFTLFNSAMTSTLNPWIYKCIKTKETDKISPVVMTLFRFLILLNIILIIFAPEIMKIFAPSSYYNAISAIPIVTMSCVFMFLYGIFVCFEFYYEKKYYITIASLVGAALNIVLNFLLIPVFGYVAAAYTTLFCYILFCFMHYIFMIKICKEQGYDNKVFNAKKMLLESLVFMFSGFLITFSYKYLLLRIIICIILVITIYKYKNNIVNLLKKLKNG